MIYKKYLSILMVSLLLIGCDDANKDKPKEPESTQAATTSAEEQIDLKAKKGNLWLDIFNADFSYPSSTLGVTIIYSSDLGHVVSNVESYLQYSSDKNGKFDLGKIRKSKGEADLSFITMLTTPNLKSIEDYHKLITKLEALPPQMPDLDTAGKVYSEYFTELATAFSELGDYYRTNKEYKLDDFAQSAQLHDKVLTAYNNYLQAETAASEAYNNLYVELHNAQKLNLKTQGLMITFNIYESLDISQDIVTLVNTTLTQKGNFKDFDKSILAKKITQLESIINDLKQNKGDEQLLTKEGLRSFRYDEYLGTLPSFLVQVKVILRDLQEKNIASEVEELNREFNKVVSSYNDVIR